VRYLVISDIHANIDALDTVLADAASIGYDAVLCLGDLVGYGAAPSASIERVVELGPAGLIRGNHDKVIAGLEPPILFNEVARKSVDWTQGVLSVEATKTLADLAKGPLQIDPDVEICHGAPFDEDHYLFDNTDAERAMAACTTRICLYGHTHLPAIFTKTTDRASAGDGLADDELRLPEAGPVLINVGSVGQPRDGDPRAAYGLLDLERHTIRFRRVAYDVPAAQKRIMAAGLPAWLALRLEKGQ
jgi:diadenosine tetraphosphatase ApaH/serine/threonine PP2A family protein phosphatase